MPIFGLFRFLQNNLTIFFLCRLFSCFSCFDFAPPPPQKEPEEKADILVSELLGSWGDNELSPECLDGAQRFLKEGGVSIHQEYSSYVAPMSSHKVTDTSDTADTADTALQDTSDR